MCPSSRCATLISTAIQIANAAQEQHLRVAQSTGYHTSIMAQHGSVPTIMAHTRISMLPMKRHSDTQPLDSPQTKSENYVAKRITVERAKRKVEWLVIYILLSIFSTDRTTHVRPMDTAVGGMQIKKASTFHMATRGTAIIIQISMATWHKMSVNNVGDVSSTKIVEVITKMLGKRVMEKKGGWQHGMPRALKTVDRTTIHKQP